MERTNSQLCPDAELTALMESIRSAASAPGALDAPLSRYPQDARLHFLKGSLLAGEQDYAGARIAMRHAVDLAPDYAVARFQLGLLLLSSGEPHAAQETWGPLHGSLPPNHYLRIFVSGLTHLIRDEFDDTVRLLSDGISRNRENPAMNGDMQRIIDEVRARPRETSSGKPMSSVDFLLQQSAFKDKSH
jgi:tetratricopeptide (TPR) repeat protein